MVSLKSKLALSLCFLVSSVFAFSGLNDPIVTKPIDPIPMDTPCTGGSEASASECASAGVACRFGQTCYRAFRGGWSGGVESFGYCYHCEGESGTITPVEPGIDIGDIVIKECISGSVQYRPNGNCGTQENKCCGNGKWSGFGVSCPSGADLCTSSQCWNGSICQNKDSVSRPCSGNVMGASGGTQTRTGRCVEGSGWIYGLWSGSCICQSNLSWDGSKCVLSGGTLPIGCAMVGALCTDCVGRKGTYINDATNKCCCSANVSGGAACCLVNMHY